MHSVSVIKTINLLLNGEIRAVCSDMHTNVYIKVMVKWSRYRPGVAQRVGRGIALLFHDHGTRRGWVVSSTPRPHFTPGKPRYPFYRRLGGPQGRSGRAENLVPTRIRSRTVQPVVGRYTDWATRPTHTHTYICICIYVEVAQRWSAVLQIGRSLVRFQLVSVDFSWR